MRQTSLLALCWFCQFKHVVSNRQLFSTPKSKHLSICCVFFWLFSIALSLSCDITSHSEYPSCRPQGTCVFLIKIHFSFGRWVTRGTRTRWCMWIWADKLPEERAETHLSKYIRSVTRELRRWWAGLRRHSHSPDWAAGDEMQNILCNFG